MFHVKPFIYVRTELHVPGAGQAVHIAELKELDADTCEMVRIIELDPNDTIMGIAGGDIGAGAPMQPQAQVPHPDTYKDFPDIKATILSSDQFEALWAEGVARLT